MANKTLMTDFYELTMAQTYFDQGKEDEKVYFDLFFRKNPFNGGYTISGGLDNIIEYIKNFKFSEKEINYLRSLGKFSEEFLSYLKNLKFTGDIYAIPDGTPIFPNEPVMTVKAKIIEAQIIETALLANFNHASLVTTAARRITNEANGKAVMEFGARRARGEDSAIEASKYAYIGGCVGTSNTYSGMKYKIPVMGTMAHSLITEADTEYEAFLNYAKSNPDNCVFLVDTYDTLRSGIPNAIKVAKEYLIPNGHKFKGIRIDSGDLAYLSNEARKMLDDSGFKDATICLSNGLNEYTIRDLVMQGASFDSLGVGDNIAAAKERVGGVYKLVATEKDGVIIPKMKVSEDTIKTINPGYKKVYRFYDKNNGYALGDLIALADEKIPLEQYTLIHPVENWKQTTLRNYNLREMQVPIYINGKLVYQLPSVEERKEYCYNEFMTFYPEIKRLTNPHEYYVDLSQKLLDLKNRLIEEHQKRALEETTPVRSRS
ncbi:MAG: nicotinate phosphoribosyltransferase [Mollicutes bacterium]|nr:nicotinate phosphoribosyltransferase [Mollicutes bacterium]